MAKLFYTKHEGKKSTVPLFLLHSIPLDGNYLRKSIEGYELPITTYIIDLPSHGQSEIVETENLNFDFMAKEIEKLRAELGYAKIIIYGHGVGAIVAQAYATQFENKLDALILSNTAPDARFREQLGWNIRQRYSKTTLQVLNRLVGKTDDKSIRERYTQSYAYYFDPVNHEASKLLMDGASRIATEEYVHFAQNDLSKFTYRDALRKLNVRILILAGSKDVWPEFSIKLLISDIEHAETKIMKGGHFLMLEGAKIYWNTVFDWLNLGS